MHRRADDAADNARKARVEAAEKIKLYKNQWEGWDAYIRKFLMRPAYRQTWWEIRDEYDKGLVAYMDSIAPPPKR